VYDAPVRKHVVALCVVLILLGVGCKTTDRGVVRNEASKDVYVSSVPELASPGCQSVQGLGRSIARNSSLRLPPGRIGDLDLQNRESSTNVSFDNCIAASLDGLEDWKIVPVGDLVLIVDITERNELLLFESARRREERVLNWPLLFLIGGTIAMLGIQGYRVRKRRPEATLETNPSEG